MGMQVEPESTGRYQQVKRIVMDALDHQGKAREEWIATQCGGDAALEAEVRALLAGIEGDATLAISMDALAVPAGGAATPDLSGQGASAQTPRVYRLLRRLGAGGMGVVYLAERSDGGFVQRVALKLLNAVAEASPELRERFARERALLARLEHPGIARLLDGGILGDGRPFLAMEYVEGERIDVHAAGLALQQRIALFLKVCDAVADAHRCLVIHRDIKPANILVDARGEPKLLDFGIARLIEEGDVAAARTETGQHALTLAYASPEQVACEPLTTATDVYSLGAVLYQLVCGSAPFANVDTPAGLYQAIIHTDVTPPSRRLARGDAGPPRGQGAAVPADVDAIVLKALRKEPAQRYPSVAALADDLRRYLERRPVQARDGQRWYRARRFVQRNVWAIAASLVVATSVVGGLVASLTALDRARTQQAMAEERGRQLQKMVEFQQSMLLGIDVEAVGMAMADAQRGALLAADAADGSDQRLSPERLEQAFALADPSGIAREVLDRYIVTHALEQIDRDVAGDPVLAADLRQRLARVAAAFGSNERAEQEIRRVLDARAELPAESDEVLSARLDLAIFLNALGRTDEAEPLYLELLAATDGRDVEDPLRRQALAGVAAIDAQRGRFPEALERYAQLRDALARSRAETDKDLLQVRRLRAEVLTQAGRRDEAAAETEALLPLFRATLGDGHRETLSAMFAHARLLRDLKRFEPSLALANEAVEVLTRRYGRGHPETLDARYLAATNALRLATDDAGLARIQAEAEDIVLRRRLLFGAEAPQTISPLTVIVVILDRRAGLSEAGSTAEHAFLDQAIAVQRRILAAHLQGRGADHPNTLLAHGSLASVLRKRGRYGEALEQAQICREGQERVLGLEHPMVSGIWDLIGDIHRDNGQLEQSRIAHETALGLRLKTTPGDSPDVLESAIRLYEILQLQGRRAEADTLKARHLDALLAMDPAALDSTMTKVRDEALRTLQAASADAVGTTSSR